MEFNGDVNPRLMPNPRRTMWMDDKVFDLDTNLWARDYLFTDHRQSVVLYRVDLAKSGDRDSLYGETDPSKIIFLPPVELFGVVDIEKQDLKSYSQTNSAGLYQKPGKMNFYVLERELEEQDVEIRTGDYLLYLTGQIDKDNHIQEQYVYLVDNNGKVNPDNEHSFHGFKPLWRTVTASFVDGLSL